MATFELLEQKEIVENYQGLVLTNFSFRENAEIENGQLLEEFIRSKHFRFESLREPIRTNSKGDLNLRGTFNFDNIKTEDFKNFSKKEITSYLINFINTPDWYDDRNDFAKLLDFYFKVQVSFEEKDFFLITKDWFAIDDIRVIDPNHWIFTYHFIIIYIDRQSSKLSMSEWMYD